mmetsp:Transcript_51872/g.76874  ORF Transcript_51872/g.76874 Transcript_51872/m.76874 type:complete len:306 (-) Transcript_51872:15-932(-)
MMARGRLGLRCRIRQSSSSSSLSWRFISDIFRFWRIGNTYARVLPLPVAAANATLRSSFPLSSREEDRMAGITICCTGVGWARPIPLSCFDAALGGLDTACTISSMSPNFDHANACSDFFGFSMGTESSNESFGELNGTRDLAMADESLIRLRDDDDDDDWNGFSSLSSLDNNDDCSIDLQNIVRNFLILFDWYWPTTAVADSCRGMQPHLLPISLLPFDAVTNALQVERDVTNTLRPPPIPIMVLLFLEAAAEHLVAATESRVIIMAMLLIRRNFMLRLLLLLLGRARFVLYLSNSLIIASNIN